MLSLPGYFRPFPGNFHKNQHMFTESRVRSSQKVPKSKNDHLQVLHKKSALREEILQTDNYVCPFEDPGMCVCVFHQIPKVLVPKARVWVPTAEPVLGTMRMSDPKEYQVGDIKVYKSIPFYPHNIPMISLLYTNSCYKYIYIYSYISG